MRCRVQARGRSPSGSSGFTFAQFGAKILFLNYDVGDRKRAVHAVHKRSRVSSLGRERAMRSNASQRNLLTAAALSAAMATATAPVAHAAPLQLTLNNGPGPFPIQEGTPLTLTFTVTNPNAQPNSLNSVIASAIGQTGDTTDA